jgi:hypothetical protein
MRRGKAPIPAETKAAMVEDLKAGHGVTQIAADYNVSRSTVALLREQNRDALPNWKRRTAKAMQDLVTDLVDDLQKNIDELKPANKSILVGILTDKIRDLSGDNTQTVEHRHLHIDHRDVNSLLTDKNTVGNTPNTKEKDSRPETRHTPASPADIIDIEPQKESQHESQTGGGGSR